MSEAILVARKLQPNNAHVMTIVSQGLPGTLRVNRSCPTWVLAWIKTAHNKFHGGSGTTLVEMYVKVEDLEREWHDDSLSNHINSSICPKTGEFTYLEIQRR